MPKAETPLGEKPSFDVYAMMLILGFLATLGATLVMKKDLDENWRGYSADGRLPKVAEGVTKHNGQSAVDLVANEKPSKEPVVTPEDLEDWTRIAEMNKDWGMGDKPAKYKPLPGWYKPTKAAVSTLPGKDNTTLAPEAELLRLKESYVERDPTKSPEEGGGTTPPPAPAPAPGGAAPAPAP